MDIDFERLRLAASNSEVAMVLVRLSSSSFNPPQPPLHGGNSIFNGLKIFFFATSMSRKVILLFVVQSGYNL